jgi:TnpA family transposase
LKIRPGDSCTNPGGKEGHRAVGVGNGTTSFLGRPVLPRRWPGAKRGDVNAHYGDDSGSKFYTWVSDQRGHFHILPMGATEDEAICWTGCMDMRPESKSTRRASDHVFSLSAVGGKRVAPLLRGLKDWRLHAFGDTRMPT